MNDTKPAFPQPYQVCNEEMVGMTLRDYFAAKAMQAAITSQPEIEDIRVIAVASYQMADAMLETRK